MFHDFPAWSINGRFKYRVVFDSVFPDFRIEELITSLVAREQDEAPDKICEKSTDQNDRQDGQPLPELSRAVLQSQRLDGIARSKPIGKASTHYTRKHGHANPFAQ